MSLTDLAAVKRYMNLASLNSDQSLLSLIPDQSQTFLDETARTTFDATDVTEVRDGMGSDVMQLSFFPVNSFASLQIGRRTVPLSTQPFMSGYVWNALGKVSLRCWEFECGRQNVIAAYNAGYVPITVSNELQTITPVNAKIPWPEPYTIYVFKPNWLTDGGVKFFGGAALTPVLGPPNTGEYFVMGSGAYLFAAADVGRRVQISYTAAGYPSDLVGAVNRMVLLRYRQKDQMEVSSMSIGGTVTTYNNKDYPADVWRVIKKYKKYFFTPGF